MFIIKKRFLNCSIFFVALDYGSRHVKKSKLVELHGKGAAEKLSLYQSNKWGLCSSNSVDPFILYKCIVVTKSRANFLVFF